MEDIQKIREQQAKTQPSQPNPQDEAIQSMISQILDQPARERLNRVKIVNPSRATQVETMIVKLAQSGQLPGRIGESELIHLLDSLSRNESGSKLVFRRNDRDLDEYDDELNEPQSNNNQSDSDDFFD